MTLAQPAAGELGHLDQGVEEWKRRHTQETWHTLPLPKTSSTQVGTGVRRARVPEHGHSNRYSRTAEDHPA